MISDKKTVLKIMAGKPEEGFQVRLEACEKIKFCVWKVTDAAGAVVCDSENNGSTSATVRGQRVDISAAFPAQMWSVEKPELYTFSIELTYANDDVESIHDRFGFRYFSTDEKYIYLNGFPFYMRAYIRGCTAHEHENNCGLETKDFYRKNILMAKKYGFNAIRFHSTIPPRECFEAADELGILIHIETRADNSDYENLEEMLFGLDDLVTDQELKEIIERLYNHPSFMVYCVGNEIRTPGKNKRIKEIRDFIKANDPTRLFIDTCAHGEYDRSGVDFDVQHMGYFFPYGEHADMFSDTDNLLCFGTVKDSGVTAENEYGSIKRALSFHVPLLAHEVCHYTSWRDFYALKKKFEEYGIPAPWWVEEEIKMLEAKGYKENFAEIFQITKDFQFRCWKTAIEGIRSSKLLSGFHMLQFADTERYENSNGIVDCFDDPQGISDESFRAFNADTVLVARLPKQVCTGGERIKIPVILSQFALNPPKSGVFHYELRAANADQDSAEVKAEIYAHGKLGEMDTARSGVYDFCTIECRLPEGDRAEKLELVCRIDFEDGTCCKNQWELWVFTRQEGKLRLAAAVDMRERYLDKAFVFEEEAPLIITDKLDESLFEKLEAGKDVMLLYRTDWTRHLLHKDMKAPKYSFKHTWDRFKGVIWDRGTMNGGFDDKELLNKYGFCTDGQLNFQYYDLVNDCDKINLDDFPVAVKSIVSGIDKSSRDRFDVGKFKLSELQYDRTMRHFSYVFELRVGKGRLVVTGFNFTDTETGNIAACAMLKALTMYCNSKDFAPEAYMESTALQEYLMKTAQAGPQKEGMMTQYWQLDEEPVESMEYWTESERYLREA